MCRIKFGLTQLSALVVGLIALSSCSAKIEQIKEASPEARLGQTKVIKLSDDYLTESLLVKFTSSKMASEFSLREGIKSFERVFPKTPGKEGLEKEFGLDRWYEIVLDKGSDLEGLVREFEALDCVSVIQYNSKMQREASEIVYPSTAESHTKAEQGEANPSFNDPMLVNQWHYINSGNASVAKNVYRGGDVNVKDVWKYLCTGDPDIIVAVVDEGVKYNHPDLAANMWVNKGEIPGNGIDDDGNGYVDDVYGYNFCDGGPITWDQTYDSGHGTHCAGTIAAVNNNKIGVCGVAGGSGKGDGCRIMSCQIFSNGGGGYTSATVKAIKYAADNGASIISCSFGYSSSFASDNAYLKYNSAEADAVHYFEACKNNSVLDGNIAIFAAGNESHSYAHYPGALHDFISVSALGPDFLPTYYTNYGPGCNIAAPGGEFALTSNENGQKSMVLSTLPSELYNSDYGYMQGTSMACPHVSGVVALALSYAKQQGKHFSRDEFKQMILSSVNDIDKRINANKSKTYVNNAKPELQMAPFYHKMGTGAIDSWRLMMKIDGVPSLTLETGKSQWLDLSPHFGSASVSLTYLGVNVPESTISSLGLQKIGPAGEYAYIQHGRLYIYPTKIGSGTVVVNAVGGGDILGGGDNPPGGMKLETKISLVARDAIGGNGVGGWL